MTVTNRAYFLVSYDLLAKLLPLPAGAEIFATQDDTEIPTALRVYVTHSDLPARKRGAAIPEVHPSWRRQEAIAFEGWGASSVFSELGKREVDDGTA